MEPSGPLYRALTGLLCTLCSNAWKEKQVFYRFRKMPCRYNNNNQQVSEIQDLINQFNIIEVAEFITIDNDNGPESEDTMKK